MRSSWGLALLLVLPVAPAVTQSAEELVNDALTPDDVLLHSMGY